MKLACLLVGCVGKIQIQFEVKERIKALPSDLG
jgi:hypothetical protein